MKKYLNYKILVITLIFASMFLVFLKISFAEEELKEPIIVNGDKVEYLYEEKKVVGVNNVVITYKKMKLTCDKIVVHMDTKKAIAEGNVKLIQGKSVFRGEKVHYNFETEKGTIIKAEAKRKPWYGKGEVASKVDDKEYVIERGSITTCDLPHPHYRIQARRLKIFIDDRVEARHLKFFVGDVPIFYFPYYVHYLNDKRPRVTIVPGRNSRWGYYLLTAWRYYFHEWSRGYVHLDWREKKGFAEGIDYKYKFGYWGKGLARFYYTRENHVTTGEEVDTGQSVGENRWRLQLRHKWQIDKDTLATGELHKMSDKLFIKDYFFNEEYLEEEQPQTYISIIRTRPKYNLNLLFRTRINDFYTVVERLPELKMNVKSQRLRDTNFYYTSTTSFVMLQKKFEDTIDDEKLKVNRFDTDNEFSYVAKLFNFLSFTPYIQLQETWYSEDDLGEKNEFRHAITLGSKFSTKFYKLYPFTTNAFGLDINELKHIVTPKLNYRIRPAPNIKAADLKQFDEIDKVRSRHGILMELVQTLLTRRDEGKKIVDLLRFTTSTELFLKPYDNKTLDDIRNDLIFTPYPWLKINADTRFSPKDGNMQAANVDIVAEKDDFWRIGTGYRFEEGDFHEGDSIQVTADAYYRISPKWKVTAYHRYRKDPDSSDFEIEEQTYGIERDLHCWLAELSYQFKQNDGLEEDNEHRVWLVMRLKAFPELPIKMFSAKYQGPRAGVRSEERSE